MASRRSHAASHSRNANQRRVIRNFVSPCSEGTRIYQKPTASSEGAQLWDRHPLTLTWFRKAGPTIILNIIVDASVPLRGTIFRWRCRIYPQLRCFAVCSGFHDIGPVPRNPQLILNLLPFVGAWLRRDAIASYVSFFCSSPHATSV